VYFVLSSSGAQRLFDHPVLPNEYNQSIKVRKGKKKETNKKLRVGQGDKCSATRKCTDATMCCSCMWATSRDVK